MRGNEFLDKMGLVNPEYIEAAETAPIKKKNVWVRWTVLAACLCIIIGIIMFLRSAELDKNTDITDNSTLSDTHTNMPIDEIETEITDYTDEEEIPTNKGLYIPPVELPEGDDIASMDMLGVVVYKGGIYTQTELYLDERAYEMEHLVGEYIGLAKGNLHEWSTQEDYAQEFASSVYGEVYTVNGYDPDFRICVRNEYTWEGEHYIMIEFLDRLNDIYLESGEDLFEDRLHVKERLVNIQWQSHDAWNYGGDVNDAAFDEPLWGAFLDEVYKGEFVYTYKPEGSFYEDKPYSSIFDNPNQVHLILNMEDGTTIRLRLIEGGYVGLEATGWWYFIQIPGEAFDAIYVACEGTHIEDWVVAR